MYARQDFINLLKICHIITSPSSMAENNSNVQAEDSNSSLKMLPDSY
jgi:hypothetical protein